MNRPRQGRRKGFTLVELLVAMAILAILASLAVAGLYLAQESAREARTAALISRLHLEITSRWNAYATRPLEADLGEVAALLGEPNDAQGRAKARLWAVRERLRMELPERYSDIADPPVYLPQRTAVAQQFKDWYDLARPSKAYESAECLYQIVTGPTVGEGLLGARAFSSHEIGDADGDGAPEFLDAWGRPVRFFRWAPGAAVYSEIQYDDPALAHDPLDPQGHQPESFALYPLIVSAGSDGKLGLVWRSDLRYGQMYPANNPFATSGDSKGTVGAPVPASNTTEHGGHHDNVHNHLLGSY